MQKEKCPEDFGEILYQFRRWHSGWECDATGYIVRDSRGATRLVLSNHGRWYLADATELRANIGEYEDAIVQTRKALAILEKE